MTYPYLTLRDTALLNADRHDARAHYRELAGQPSWAAGSRAKRDKWLRRAEKLAAPETREQELIDRVALNFYETLMNGTARRQS